MKNLTWRFAALIAFVACLGAAIFLGATYGISGSAFAASLGDTLASAFASSSGFLFIGMAYELQAKTTGTSLSTMAPGAVRKLWQAGIDVHEQSSDFFTPMEGGADALIWERSDTAPGRGQKIVFTTGSGL